MLLLIQQDGNDQRAGIVVGRIALGVIRHGIYRVLEDACGVREPAEVVEPEGGELPRPAVQGPRGEAGTGPPASFPPGLLEALHVTARHLGPDHLAPQQVRLLPNRVTLAPVLQQLQDGIRDGRRLAEGDETAAPVGKQLFSVPIWCRDDRFSSPDRVGQRPRDDLLRLEVGGDVDVSRAHELDQLLGVDEAIVEEDALFDPQLDGQPLEGDPI